MKKIILLVLSFLAFAISTQAQEIVDSNSRYPYYKDTFDLKVNAAFEPLWNSAKELISEMGGQLAVQKSYQNDEGLFQGTLKSDNVVLAEGSDTTFNVLQRYEYKMIYIPNNDWNIGRVNYRLLMSEIDEKTTRLRLFVQLSGFEKRITNQFHFFKSNGLLEKDFIERLYKKLGLSL